ncbi:hypothetical protein NIES2100_56260 [Calothrix sp. NIES-2100]|uniref:ATP-binding protein n=1 Tax=Calothrix sp. NIES-2100 TaxID=1954172 RepID=UPI000B61D05C|nr:hypothetical protein NIES2100_56260 [Calothrix sp. NIES-2100]
MNSLPNTINSRGHPTEFEQIITEKSDNFVGREFVFTAIDEFIHRYRRGYFTVVGAPGSGKSAIFAKYATDHPDVVYYNVEVEGKNRAEEFLKVVCHQLVEWLQSCSTPPQPSPQARRELDVQDFAALAGGVRGVGDNAGEGSWFLSVLLQQISDELEPEQKLILIIDGLDRIDSNSQSPGTNLFYLPRYLPDGVYFLLTRRPFLREKSGLLIETPSQSLDLGQYSEENWQDIQRYIQQFTLRLRSGLTDENIKSWLSDRQINEEEFCTSLAAKAENNFMYVSRVLAAIALGFDPQALNDNQVPPGLDAYYQQHWQKMMTAIPDEDFSQAVLKVLVQQQQPISVEAIAQIIDGDEFDVEEVLESWFEFLRQEEMGGEKYYSFYYGNFRDWLAEKV